MSAGVCPDCRRPVLPVRRLGVPLPLACGAYERLSDEQLQDHIADIQHEVRRRRGKLFPPEETKS